MKGNKRIFTRVHIGIFNFGNINHDTNRINLADDEKGFGVGGAVILNEFAWIDGSFGYYAIEGRVNGGVGCKCFCFS